MITLTARIELITSENGGVLNSASITQGASNVSSELSNVVKAERKGSNPFIFGASILGEGATFSNAEDYYIGNIAADSNGEFSTPYTITVNGTEIKAITIVFDDYNNQFPNRISVDGEYYLNDDPYFTIGHLTEASSHTIVIDNWNTPNYPLRMQGIYIDLTIELNRRNLISIERSIFDRTDNEEPSYGIMSNDGDIEFSDLKGEIKDYAEMDLLQSGISVEIYINNTITKTSQLIGKFDSAEWKYDNDNRSVTVKIKDDLEEWQEINIPELKYIPTVSQSMTLKEIYDWLYEQTPTEYNMLAFNELDDTTKGMLNNSVVQYPMLEMGTLWDGWDKLCQIAQAHIYKTNEGNTTFKYIDGD